jgi:hypothetical protein
MTDNYIGSNESDIIPFCCSKVAPDRFLIRLALNKSHGIYASQSIYDGWKE